MHSRPERKKYVSDNMDAVLRNIRTDFGEDGIIISQREITEGGIFGFLGKKKYEVVAGRQPVKEKQVAKRPNKSLQHNIICRTGEDFLEQLVSKDLTSLKPSSTPPTQKQGFDPNDVARLVEELYGAEASQLKPSLTQVQKKNTYSISSIQRGRGPAAPSGLVRNQGSVSPARETAGRRQNPQDVRARIEARTGAYDELMGEEMIDRRGLPKAYLPSEKREELVHLDAFPSQRADEEELTDLRAQVAEIQSTLKNMNQLITSLSDTRSSRISGELRPLDPQGQVSDQGRYEMSSGDRREGDFPSQTVPANLKDQQTVILPSQGTSAAPVPPAFDGQEIPAAQLGSVATQQQQRPPLDAVQSTPLAPEIMPEQHVSPQPPSGFEQRLSELEKKLRNLDFDQEIIETYLDLAKKSFSEEEQAKNPRIESIQQKLANVVKKTLKIRKSIFEEFEEEEPESENPKGPKIMVFVGPTGVGKTTTVAKIASHLAFEGKRKKKIALITLDTFKVGAREQLAFYARGVKASLDTVYKPEDIMPTIKKHQDKDIILIDTVGRSQNDDFMITSLKHYLPEELEAQTHLCISATTRYRDMISTISAFSRLSVDCLLFTKLDETTAFGPMISVLQRSVREISYITNGQIVPGDFKVIDADYIGDLMFRERLP